MKTLDPNSINIGKTAGGTVGMDFLSGFKMEEVGQALTLRSERGFPAIPYHLMQKDRTVVAKRSTAF
jgi:hypothetical protein